MGDTGVGRRGQRKRGDRRVFQVGRWCRAHPRAHQRNHPPTIDYYLSNLHSNRALVQICTPCFDPFGNPLQILPWPPAWLLVRHSVPFLLRCRLFFRPGHSRSISLPGMSRGITWERSPNREAAYVPLRTWYVHFFRRNPEF